MNCYEAQSRDNIKQDNINNVQETNENKKIK